MKSMPSNIKNKLRQLSRAYIKASELEHEVAKLIEQHGIDTERLDGCSCIEPYTEALAYISNAECRLSEDLESSIDEIERIFLHIVNQELKGGVSDYDNK